MHARRLGWAGVEISIPGHRLVIDAMDNTAPLKEMLGEPLWPIHRVPNWDGTTSSHALVTHRHPDHFDPEALKRTLGPQGQVFCPVEIAQEIAATGLTARGMAVWESAQLPDCDSVSITAVPAVDWRGDAQVSWVIEPQTFRIFHGGDTIWHGSWWTIAKRFPRFDVAFLPVNGVIARVKGMAPSNLPATLTPDQAAVAARLLNADCLCPIHYGQFNNPRSYREYPDIDDALSIAADREGVALLVVEDGETVLPR